MFLVCSPVFLGLELKLELELELKLELELGLPLGLELEVELSARGEVFEERDRNDEMSGDFSKRRSGFPRVIQHDILANSETMGGPVINLAGEVVGMNIARANRAETFAIPVEELRGLRDLMLGREKNEF